MYTVNNIIATQKIKSLQVLKVFKNDHFELLSISLEKDAIFPEHTSPTDAVLFVIEGSVVFHIEDKEFHLSALQIFHFPGKTSHWVTARQDSKFLIIR